jgi:hypothetical protein
MSNGTKISPKPEKARAQGASSSLRGYPGYRTREGRSGLDPIDNDAEGGHMTGIFIRRLLTGKLRTRNPFMLLLLAVFGVACIAPVLLGTLEAFRGDLLSFEAWVAIALTGLLGIAMLVNLIKNLLYLRGK